MLSSISQGLGYVEKKGRWIGDGEKQGEQLPSNDGGNDMSFQCNGAFDSVS